MWLEPKYMSLLSSQLHKFKQKSGNLWNFRCPYCNDSEKNKTKARGYVFEKNGNYVFHCHNCKESHRFDFFLKFVNPNLYNDYLLEKLSNKPAEATAIPLKKTKTHSQSVLSKLHKISRLDPSHTCKKYVVSRQIPTEMHPNLYYCQNFMKWTNTLVPEKFSDRALAHDAPRLVIPFIDSKGELFGYQGRSLDPDDKIRYITIMIDESRLPLFGLDRCNLNRKFYVLEGPIDSMFIENSLATTGGRADSVLDSIDYPKDNCVIVYDNQPLNKDVVKNMRHAVRRGLKVCVWPRWVEEKDVNEMILSKVSGDYVKNEKVRNEALNIKELIDEYTFSGIEAELEIEKWKA